MLLPEFLPFQRSLADFLTTSMHCLAGSRVCVSTDDATGNASWVASVVHQDHTPSPLGQRAVPMALLPNFLGRRMGLNLGHQKIKIAVSVGQGTSRRVGQADKCSEGSGICLFETSFLASSLVVASRLAATPSANRPLAAVLLAQGQRRSPVARSFRGPLSARRATSRTASLTPASVAATDAHTTNNRLNSRPRVAICCIGPSVRHSHIANRAAMVDAVLRVSLKTQKDIPCSRKS